MTLYEIEGERLTLWELKNRFKNVSFPAVLTQEMLTPFGVTVVEVLPPEPPAPTIEELKAAKVREIVAESDARIEALRAGYSVGEVQTFEQQNAGAREILAGTETSEPAQFVVELLTRRLGRAPTAEEKTAFASLIRSNYETAKAATLLIVGTQQNLELQVRIAETTEDVLAVHWPV